MGLFAIVKQETVEENLKAAFVNLNLWKEQLGAEYLITDFAIPQLMRAIELLEKEKTCVPKRKPESGK